MLALGFGLLLLAIAAIITGGILVANTFYPGAKSKPECDKISDKPCKSLWVDNICHKAHVDNNNCVTDSSLVGIIILAVAGAIFIAGLVLVFVPGRRNRSSTPTRG